MKKNARIMNKYLINIMMDFLCLSKVYIFPFFAQLVFVKVCAMCIPVFGSFSSIAAPILYFFSTLSINLSRKCSPCPFARLSSRREIASTCYSYFRSFSQDGKVQNVHPHTCLFWHQHKLLVWLKDNLGIRQF